MNRNNPAGAAARKPRKKPKASPSPAGHPLPISTSPIPNPTSGSTPMSIPMAMGGGGEREREERPIPRPYLALAPSPISSMSPSAADRMILPSHFIRQSQVQSQSQGHQVQPAAEAGPGPSTSTFTLNAAGSSVQPQAHAQAEPQGKGKGKEKGKKKRTRYASGLLSPPAVVPGGTPGVPRVQVYSQPGKRRNRNPNAGAETAGIRTGAGLGVSRDGPSASRTRLDTLQTHNPSQISLGQLGQVLNSDPASYDTPGEPPQQAQQPQRRRRRVVTGDTNEEGGGLRRRLTVSSREEGRALGVARGASMRRRNLWDEIPEAIVQETGEPPPPFPFPSSSNRLPGFNPSQSPSSERGRGGGGEQGDGTERRPRSPPPSWEQAVGLVPLPAPATSSDNTPRATVPPDTPTVPRLVIPDQSYSISVSPTSSRYESAPSSPFLSPLSTVDPSILHSHPPAIAIPPHLRSNLESTSASTSTSTSAFVSANPSTAPSTCSTIAVDQDLNADADGIGIGMTAEERLDRKFWNADILAGYSLEERVRREWDRRKVREQSQSQGQGQGQNNDEGERESELVQGTEVGVGTLPERQVPETTEATGVMGESQRAEGTEAVEPRPSSPSLGNGSGLGLGMGSGSGSGSGSPTVRSGSVEGSSRDVEPGSVPKHEHKHEHEGENERGPKAEHQLGSDLRPSPQPQHVQEQVKGQEQDAKKHSESLPTEVGAAIDAGQPSLSRKQATNVSTNTSMAPSTTPLAAPLLSPPINVPSHEDEHEPQPPSKPKEKVGRKKNANGAADVGTNKVGGQQSPRPEPPTIPTPTSTSAPTPTPHSKEKEKAQAAPTQILEEKQSRPAVQPFEKVKEKKEKEKTKTSAPELSSSLPKEKRKEKKAIEKKPSQHLQPLRPLFHKIPWGSSPNVDTAGLGVTSSQDKLSSRSTRLGESAENVGATGPSFDKRRESEGLQGRRLNEEVHRRKSENDVGLTLGSPREEGKDEKTGLPPNREAALKRRDLQLLTQTPKIQPQPAQPQGSMIQSKSESKSVLPRSTLPVEQPLQTSKPKADVAPPVPAKAKVTENKQPKEKGLLQRLSRPLVDIDDPELRLVPKSQLQTQPSTSTVQPQYSPTAQAGTNQEAKSNKDKRISRESITALAASSADLLQLLESSAEEGPSNSNSNLRDANQSRIEEPARDMTEETSGLDTAPTRGPSSLGAMAAATKKKIPPPPPPPLSRSRLHLSRSVGTLRPSERVAQGKQDEGVAGEDGTQNARAPRTPPLPPQLPKRRPPPPPPPRHPAAIARLPSPPPRSQSQAEPRGRAPPPPPPLPPRPRPLSGISNQTISSVSQVSSAGAPAQEQNVDTALQAQRQEQAQEPEGDEEGDLPGRGNLSPLVRRPLGPRPAPPPRPILPLRLRLFGNNQTNSGQRMDSRMADVPQSQGPGPEERDREIDTGSRFVEHIEREGIPPLPSSAPQIRTRETLRPTPPSILTPNPIPALRLNNSTATNGSRPSPVERSHSDFPPLPTQSQLRIHQMNERESDNRWASTVDLRERPLSPATSATPVVGSGGRGDGDESRVSMVETSRREEGEGPGVGLHSQAQQRGIREYTDLDLFVSRLEGSGREYEGYSQLTTFLGPSKPTAASPEAISTLLPGLITIDSRRTTPQGKVKLKLSLLGVRVGKCPICLSQFRGGEKGVLTPTCVHAAHQSCALRWFREDRRCFVCREILKEE
ncbi:hypothetical protein C367_00821 [Cryptococcus neoformans Ze90-1]|nr:hypothetical protein C367_00821 [Cryptococcus neoformans var. grubii Ze90-1]